jgi:methylated-DNA-protein-cysteine methyltransferase related protein
MSPAKEESRYDRIYRVVRRIPAGRVATYGQVAALAGFATGARLVGYALHALPSGSAVPWHRVVNAHGAISLLRVSPTGGIEQRIRLAKEGVKFDARDRVMLDQCGWRPRWTEPRTVPVRKPRKTPAQSRKRRS